jgi:hypothetical protein
MDQGCEWSTVAGKESYDDGYISSDWSISCEIVMLTVNVNVMPPVHVT